MAALLLAGLLGLSAAAGEPARAPAEPKAKAAPAAPAPPPESSGSELPSYPPPEGPATLELVESRFAELDGRMTSLSASFVQSVRLEDSGAEQRVEGDVLFRKPDLLRLTHRSPEEQTVVSDGTWLWVHRPSSNQVIRTRLEDWRKSEPLAKGLLDFGRSAELLRRYAASVAEAAPGADGHRVVTVTLRPKPAERRAGGADFTLTLKASTRDYFPYEAVLRVERAEIRSVFRRPRLNPELPDDAFRFAPPPGAEVFAAPARP